MATRSWGRTTKKTWMLLFTQQNTHRHKENSFPLQKKQSLCKTKGSDAHTFIESINSSPVPTFWQLYVLTFQCWYADFLTFESFPGGWELETFDEYVMDYRLCGS